MAIEIKTNVNRRNIIKAAGAASALQVAGPWVISARGEKPVVSASTTR